MDEHGKKVERAAQIQSRSMRKPNEELPARPPARQPAGTGKQQQTLSTWFQSCRYYIPPWLEDRRVSPGIKIKKSMLPISSLNPFPRLQDLPICSMALEPGGRGENPKTSLMCIRLTSYPEKGPQISGQEPICAMEKIRPCFLTGGIHQLNCLWPSTGYVTCFFDSRRVPLRVLCPSVRDEQGNGLEEVHSEASPR